MAVVRARSSPPYGLFAAVTFAVLATAGAVILYVMWSKAQDDTAAAQKQLASATAEKDKLANDLNGEHGVNNALANAQRSLAQLITDNKGKQEALDHYKQLDKDYDVRIQTAENSMRAQQKAFDDSLAKLRDDQTKAEADLAAARTALNALTAKGQTDLTDASGKAEDQRRKLVLQLEDAQSQIAKLNSEIRDLRLRIKNEGRGSGDVAVGEADGKVIRVNGASGEVYINLGKKDHISNGLPFTAYDPRLGVRFGTEDQAQGNGSLEVIEVGQDTSICRVTRNTPGRAIQAGDLIANIVYHNDLTRKFHFTVFGDFDLDGDGVATAAERDRLISLIQQWGGQVDDDVNAQTDYLVLGAVPKSPMIDDTAATAPADATAPAPGNVAGSVSDIRNKDQQRYDELKSAAVQLAIPVLNQNRFLAMVGYYNTTVVRY